MCVKKWLNRAWVLDNEINKLLEKQQEALGQACSVTTTLKKDKVQTSMTNSTENKMIRYADYDLQINQKIDELYQVKEEIKREIRKVNNYRYRIILFLRYTEFHSWRKIADIINNTEVNTRTRLHRSALKAIKQYIV